MKIRVRYFASVRETLGVSEEWVSLPESVRTVGDVLAFLRERGKDWADALSEEKGLKTACNLKMTGPAALLTEGCEVAFFPPVTGG